MNDHFPVNFEQWTRREQIDHISYSYTRAGLVAAILSHAGIELRDREISRDQVLKTEELAAIYLTLETEGPPSAEEIDDG